MSRSGEVTYLNSLQFQFTNTTADLLPFGKIEFPDQQAEMLGDCNQLDTLTVKSKGLQDVVSEADLQTELLIRGRIADVGGKYFIPKMGAFTVYLLMILILMWRPQGLFTRKGGRS